MLRTIELILGLPPMSQYDAAATPMWRSFTATPDMKSFVALPANVDLNEKNTSTTASAKLSETFDFSKEDMIPDLIFSSVIWKAVKGEHTSCLPPAGVLSCKRVRMIKMTTCVNAVFAVKSFIQKIPFSGKTLSDQPRKGFTLFFLQAFVINDQTFHTLNG